MKIVFNEEYTQTDWRAIEFAEINREMEEHKYQMWINHFYNAGYENFIQKANEAMGWN